MFHPVTNHISPYGPKLVLLAGCFSAVLSLFCVGIIFLAPKSQPRKISTRFADSPTFSPSPNFKLGVSRKFSVPLIRRFPGCSVRGSTWARWADRIKRVRGCREGGGGGREELSGQAQLDRKDPPGKKTKLDKWTNVQCGAWWRDGWEMKPCSVISVLTK